MTNRSERLFFLIKSHEFTSENCLNYSIQNESTFYTEKDTTKAWIAHPSTAYLPTPLLPH